MPHGIFTRLQDNIKYLVQEQERVNIQCGIMVNNIDIGVSLSSKLCSTIFVSVFALIN